MLTKPDLIANAAATLNDNSTFLKAKFQPWLSLSKQSTDYVYADDYENLAESLEQLMYQVKSEQQNLELKDHIIVSYLTLLTQKQLVNIKKILNDKGHYQMIQSGCNTEHKNFIGLFKRAVNEKLAKLNEAQQLPVSKQVTAEPQLSMSPDDSISATSVATELNQPPITKQVEKEADTSSNPIAPDSPANSVTHRYSKLSNPGRDFIVSSQLQTVHALLVKVAIFGVENLINKLATQLTVLNDKMAKGETDRESIFIVKDKLQALTALSGNLSANKIQLDSLLTNPTAGALQALDYQQKILAHFDETLAKTEIKVHHSTLKFAINSLIDEVNQGLKVIRQCFVWACSRLLGTKTAPSTPASHIPFFKTKTEKTVRKLRNNLAQSSTRATPVTNRGPTPT